MQLGEEKKTKIENTADVFELMAVCYAMLDMELSNPVAFIGKYLDSVSDERSRAVQNPNLETLNRFADEVCGIFADYPGEDYQRALAEVMRNIGGLDLLDYGEALENELTVPAILLNAINAAAGTWPIEKIRRGLGPLNDWNRTDGYIVYRRPRQLLHERLVEKIGRDMPHESGLEDILSNFFILRKRDIAKGAGIPRIYYMEEEKERAADAAFRVAAISTSGMGVFERIQICGSQIVVQYNRERQQAALEQLLKSMEMAIQKGAEVILLPEYTVSGEMLTEIARRLAAWKRQYPGAALKIVFAGTTWTPDNNNVQHILDSWGNEIGVYYKYSCFTRLKRRRKPMENSMEGEQTTRRSVPVYRETEALQNPGKECSMVQIGRLGCFLPAICRDVTDERYTSMLVRTFRPVFVMTSAWSPSGNSFFTAFRRYAESYYSNSAFCNGCGALAATAMAIGGGMAITKKGTMSAGYEKKVERDKKRCKRCAGSCLCITEYDFDATGRNETDRIRVLWQD